MYIFKNAIKSITRSKTRNILIGVIICIIGVASCIALCINSAATDLRENYRASYNITAEFSLDRGAMREDVKEKTEEDSETTIKDFMSEISSIDVDSAKTYSDSEYVKSLNLTISSGFNSDTLTKVEDTTFSRTKEVAEGENPQMPNGGKMNFPGKDNSDIMGSSGDFKVVGYNTLQAMTEFINSKYKIKEGQIFDIESSDNTCVISTELAEENELSVGSTITLLNPYDETQSFMFTVAGIYEDSSESSEFSMFSNASNQILTTYNSLNNIIEGTEENEETKLDCSVSAVFNLIGEDVTELFENEVREKGLSVYYMMTTNLNELDNSLAPLDNLLSFSKTFFILVLSIGGSILVVLNMLNVRERKYEIGVLRAIGMKARTVLMQFVVELIIVTTVSLIIGATIGSFVSVPVATKMLESEVESVSASQDKINKNFGGGIKDENMGVNENMQNRGRGNMMEMLNKTADVDYVEQLNAVVDAIVLIELAGVGILLTVISSSISMIFIARYTPLKILSNRS